MIELSEQGDSSFDPVGLWLIRRNAHHPNEVTRVACRLQHSVSLSGFVDRAGVAGLLGNIGPETRLEPQNRTHIKQYLWQRVHERLPCDIIASSFKVKPDYVYACDWGDGVALLYHFEVEVKLVNGNASPPRVVLQGPCEEPMCEEELVDPEEFGDARPVPFR